MRQSHEAPSNGGLKGRPMSWMHAGAPGAGPEGANMRVAHGSTLQAPAGGFDICWMHATTLRGAVEGANMHVAHGPGARAWRGGHGAGGHGRGAGMADARARPRRRHGRGLQGCRGGLPWTPAAPCDRPHQREVPHMKLSGVLIGSADPQRLADYYAQVLGEPGFADGGYVGWMFGSAWVTVGPHSEVTGSNPQPGRLIWNLESDDVRADAARIRGSRRDRGRGALHDGRRRGQLDRDLRRSGRQLLPAHEPDGDVTRRRPGCEAPCPGRVRLPRRVPLPGWVPLPQVSRRRAAGRPPPWPAAPAAPTRRGAPRTRHPWRHARAAPAPSASSRTAR